MTSKLEFDPELKPTTRSELVAVQAPETVINVPNDAVYAVFKNDGAASIRVGINVTPTALGAANATTPLTPSANFKLGVTVPNNGQIYSRALPGGQGRTLHLVGAGNIYVEFP